MRKLKLMLADGKAYVFTTLSRTQVQALRGEERSAASLARRKRIEELNEKFTSKTGAAATTEETKELAKLEEQEMSNIINIIRTSMAITHKEFGPASTPEKDAEIVERINNLIDMRDFNRITVFAVSGTLPVEEETIIKDADIDLTK